MSYKIVIEEKAEKFIKNLEAEQRKDISFFLRKTLPNCNNPCALLNCKKLKGFADNHYRWRVGDYRVIGKIENGEYKILRIIKIAKRDDRTYKGL